MSRYITLDEVEAAPQAEADVEVGDTGRAFRVRSLSQDEWNYVRRQGDDATDPNGRDSLLIMQLQAAIGLVEPNLGWVQEDKAARARAHARAKQLPMPALIAIGQKVTELTNGKDGDFEAALRSFFPVEPAATESGRIHRLPVSVGEGVQPAASEAAAPAAFAG